MIVAIALTLSFIFFVLAARAERTAGDHGLLRPLLAIIGILVFAMALVSHEVLLATLAGAATAPG